MIGLLWSLSVVFLNFRCISWHCIAVCCLMFVDHLSVLSRDTPVGFRWRTEIRGSPLGRFGELLTMRPPITAYNKIWWTWLLPLRSSRLKHSSIRPSWHYWYEYIQKTTQECTFWSYLQLTIADAPGRVVRRSTNLALIDWLIDWLCKFRRINELSSQ